jgi:molybdate/tungstate transport system substrate-binding protein
MKKHPLAVGLAFFLILGTCTAGCGGKAASGSAASAGGQTSLVLVAADSLIIPFGDVVKAFDAEYPAIQVESEYHGSIQVIRQVSDLHRSIDVIATADASLIPMLMYATKDPDTGKPNASWYIRFASNKLAIAYRPTSRYASEINAENWFTILSRPDVQVGLADPRFDAVGYRALMALALAQEYYDQPTIFQKFLYGNFTYPLDIFQSGGMTTITVSEILETKTGSHIVLRGTSLEVLELLESGDLDYTFEYESVIQQHHLSMVILPDAINLGEQADNPTYATVQVDLDDQRFASVNPQFQGAQIGYGITIPSGAPHPAAAALFIAFLLGPRGQAIMQADSNPTITPALANQYANIPRSLQALCIPTEAP